jgi:hypothetical protein
LFFLVAPPPPGPPELAPSSTKKGRGRKKAAETPTGGHLSAIREGIQLRSTKDLPQAAQLKKSWIPFNVDKITQRRSAMEESDDEGGNASWSE